MENKSEQINKSIEIHSDCADFAYSSSGPEEDKFVDELARAIIFIARSMK
jgi:hypothetical protein